MGEDEGARHSHQGEPNDKHFPKSMCNKSRSEASGKTPPLPHLSTSPPPPPPLPHPRCSCSVLGAVGYSRLLVQNANMLGNSCQGPMKVPQQMDTLPLFTLRVTEKQFHTEGPFSLQLRLFYFATFPLYICLLDSYSLQGRGGGSMATHP